MNVASPHIAPDRLASASETDANPDALVRLTAVSKHFEAKGEATAAVDQVDLIAPRGSITAIIGRSGAGKSTLIRLVNGLEKPTSGQVIVDGVEVSALPEADLRGIRRSIGMIFQHFNLLSSRNAFDNVALPLEIAGYDRKAIEQKVTPLLELVGLADKRDRYPAELSGGQKQRVGIARALATDPKLLLSDEATSALDPETTRSVLELLKRINAELGLTILLITHEMEVVKRIADQVLVIDKGRIVERGPTIDVLTAPRHETTRSLLAGQPGYRLPEELEARLKPQAFPGSHPVMRIAFAGDNGLSLAKVTEAVGPDHLILAGASDDIGGRPFGAFIISILQGPAEAALARLTALGFHAEVLGHVE